MKRIRKGDTVILIAGKSKGLIGKVLRIIGDSLLVEGANLIKKHVKPNPQVNEPGGIKSKEAPVNVSNVAIYNQDKKGPDKIGFKYIDKNGQKVKVRYFKSNDELIDLV